MALSIGLGIIILGLAAVVVYRVKTLRIIEGMLREYVKKKPLVKEKHLLLGLKNFHYSLGFAVIIIAWQQLIIEYGTMSSGFLSNLTLSKIIIISLLLLVLLFGINAFIHIQKAFELVDHVEGHQKRPV